MISIQVNEKQLKELTLAVGRAKKSFPKELAAAINETAKKTRLNMGREIRETVNIKKKDVEKSIKISATATGTSLKGVVSLKKDNRVGLQHFGGRQNKSGVSYKISKSGGRKTIAGAFMGPKPGQLAPKLHGGVFRRASTTRLPIIKLYGVSPYGAFIKNNFDETEVVFINKTLQAQIERRIKLNVLRANGLVSK